MTRKRRNNVVRSAPCSSRPTMKLVALIKTMTIARKMHSRQPVRSSEGP